MKKLASACLVGAVALLMASCSDESSGQPTTTSSGTASSSAPSGGAELPHSGAPAVNDPLPETVVEGDPCSALTSEQIQYVLGNNAPQGKHDDTPAGPQCDWRDSTSGSGFLVGFDTDGQGLSAVYANSKPDSSRFEELPSIDGYPTVRYQVKPSTRTCLTSVGLANEYSITVNFGTTPEKVEEVQPCEVSSKIAEMVVGNLKQKAGG